MSRNNILSIQAGSPELNPVVRRMAGALPDYAVKYNGPSGAGEFAQLAGSRGRKVSNKKETHS